MTLSERRNREIEQYADERTAAFRRTLDRLPDEIALAIGLHVFDKDSLRSSYTCVCGWAVREAIAREVNREAESVDGQNCWEVVQSCAAKFGGDVKEWDDVFEGVYGGTLYGGDPIRIEEALFDRVMAAATTTKPKRSPTTRRR